MFLASLIKVVVLHYGVPRTYLTALPLFLGFIAAPRWGPGWTL